MIKVDIKSKLIANGVDAEKAGKVEEVLSMPEVQTGIASAMLMTHIHGMIKGIAYGAIAVGVIVLIAYWI